MIETFLKTNTRSVTLLANNSTFSDAVESDLKRYGWKVTRELSMSQTPIVMFLNNQAVGYRAIAVNFYHRN
jgi:ribonucleotide monophosphatase NagD (HAD superfamily)